MAVKQVFILWSYPLFYESVRRLLDDEGIEIVGAGSELSTARTEIETLRPDTILIEQSEEGAAISPEILTLIEVSSWGPSIISMSLRDNELWVYQREQKTVKQPEDLLDLIRSNK